MMIFGWIMATTTFRIYFRISHSLPQLGEVEKHGHSMSLEATFKNPQSDWLVWRSEVRARLKALEAELDGNWIDDYLEPATSENLLLWIFKKSIEWKIEDLVALALQETAKNRFVLKTV